MFLLILFVWLSDETPLHRSARGGHLAICRLLLQCNANPSEREFYVLKLLPSLLTSLLFSCSEAVFTHVFVLLFFRKKAPLHYSAYQGHLETCRLLVESNADVTLRRSYIYEMGTKRQDRHDDTALQLAIRQNNADVVAYLRSIGAPE